MTYGDLAMDSCAQFLAEAEHRLIPSRVRSVGHSLRGDGHQSVWPPACQDKVVAGGHAGVGVVSLGAAPLALPTFATAGFLGFFKLERALRVTLPTGNGIPTGNGRVVHLFVIYGYQGAEEDAEKMQLTDKLLQAVLAEVRVVCTGQPVLIAGGLNADPAVIPCLAKTISAGRFVDLALAYSLGEGKRPAATCMFKLDECSRSRRDFSWVVLLRLLLPVLSGSLIGGFLLIFQYLLAVVLMGGRPRFPALLSPSLYGPHAGLTLLKGLRRLYLVLFRMPGTFIGRNLGCTS